MCIKTEGLKISACLDTFCLINEAKAIDVLLEKDSEDRDRI